MKKDTPLGKMDYKDDEEMGLYKPTIHEDPLLFYPPGKKKQKKYANCERATKGLIRCINMQRFKMKMGQECVSFCQKHIVEAISKVLLIILQNRWYVDY